MAHPTLQQVITLVRLARISCARAPYSTLHAACDDIEETIAREEEPMLKSVNSRAQEVAAIAYALSLEAEEQRSFYSFYFEAVCRAQHEMETLAQAFSFESGVPNLGLSDEVAYKRLTNAAGRLVFIASLIEEKRRPAKTSTEDK